MTRACCAILICGLAACGDDDARLGLTAQVRVGGLTKAEVSSLEGFVFEPRLGNDTTILTCLSLVAGDVDPRGDEVVTLGGALASVDQNEEVELRFSAIPAGDDRVIYIEAYSPSAVLNGRGCAEGVSIPGGEPTRVDIVVEGL